MVVFIKALIFQSNHFLFVILPGRRENSHRSDSKVKFRCVVFRVVSNPLYRKNSPVAIPSAPLALSISNSRLVLLYLASGPVEGNARPCTLYRKRRITRCGAELNNTPYRVCVLVYLQISVATEPSGPLLLLLLLLHRHPPLLHSSTI